MRPAGAEIIEVELPSIDKRGTPDGSWGWEHGEPVKSMWTVAKVNAYNAPTPISLP